MSHHGSIPDPGLVEALRHSLAEYTKKEGQYPRGKLTPHDEGAQTFGVGANKGKVIIQFASPTAWIGMEPDQADELAEILRKRAIEARGQRG